GLVEAALLPAVAFPDALPAETRGRLELPLLPDALTALHRPRDHGEAELARRRLAFDELLVLQLGLARRTREREGERAPALGTPGRLVARYLELLPFELTPHQRSAIAEIDADLARATPMQRLLQGDVGSGKTVVALYALLRVGVEQRRALAEGRSPHVLHMTATPIPRTLALTVYGDLAVSEIAKPPASRKPVVTSWIPEEKASKAYQRLRRLLAEGRQAYVV